MIHTASTMIYIHCSLQLRINSLHVSVYVQLFVSLLLFFASWLMKPECLKASLDMQTRHSQTLYCRKGIDLKHFRIGNCSSTKLARIIIDKTYNSNNWEWIIDGTQKGFSIRKRKLHQLVSLASIVHWREHFINAGSIIKVVQLNMKGEANLAAISAPLYIYRRIA